MAKNMLFETMTVEYNGQTYQKNSSEIVMINQARMGGTFLMQVLDNIFLPTVRVFHHHDPVGISKRAPTVIPYRDPRDKLASQYRIYEGQAGATPEQWIKGAIMQCQQDLEPMLYWWDHERGDTILWMQYEKFYENYDYIFDTFEKFFKIEIPDFVKEYIRKETNVDKNLERTKELQKMFPIEKVGWGWHDRVRDGANRLNIAHVDPNYKGKPGSWKKIIPEEFHELVEKEMAPYVKKFGYAD